MSLPPEIIQVKRLVKKRKATDDDDEDVVDFLRVDGDRKRPRSDAYIYKRRTQGLVDSKSTAGRAPPTGPVPVIHPSNPGDENRNVENISRLQTPKPNVAAQTLSNPKDDAPSVLPGPAAAPRVSKSQSASEPRRFHMSRQSLVPSPLFSPGLTTGKRSRHKIPTTVFVERGHKRTRTEDVQMSDADVQLPTKNPVQDGDIKVSEIARKQKLPGSDRKGAEGKPAHMVKRQVPMSFQTGNSTDMDEITRSMNEFVLQQIGENLARIEERDRKEASAAAKKTSLITSAQSSKFKPKPPMKRYSERHPALAAVQTNNEVTVPATDGYETLSEDEYVIETYIRVPAKSLEKDLVPEKVGLLVFDNEPDVDYFYGEEGDTDDEWPEDDEDENAEDYYAADYPDEEVDSEDEYNRAAYQYRTSNASDLEEYDERDDEIALGFDEEKDGEPGTLPARFGARLPTAFQGS